MNHVINKHTPCTVDLETLPLGGVAVTIHVPTPIGIVDFNLSVDRDADGDWRASIPWPEWEQDSPMSDTHVKLENGMESLNGLVYMAAPDVKKVVNEWVYHRGGFFLAGTEPKDDQPLTD